MLRNISSASWATVTLKPNASSPTRYISAVVTSSSTRITDLPPAGSPSFTGRIASSIMFQPAAPGGEARRPLSPPALAPHRRQAPAEPSIRLRSRHLRYISQCLRSCCCPKNYHDPKIYATTLHKLYCEDSGIAGEQDQPIYSIGAVARMLDIPASTLRAWEDRYSLISPRRSEASHRLYSRGQVEKLRFIKSQIDSGMSAAA